MNDLDRLGHVRISRSFDKRFPHEMSSVGNIALPCSRSQEMSSGTLICHLNSVVIAVVETCDVGNYIEMTCGQHHARKHFLILRVGIDEILRAQFARYPQALLRMLLTIALKCKN